MEAKAEISASTVSNIEHGKIHVQTDNLETYANVFNLSLKQILHQIKTSNNEDELIAKELSHIETKIDRVKPEIILRNLRKIKVSNKSHAWYCYLLGKAYFNKKKYPKAFDYFKETIQFIDEHPELEKTNLKACSYKELGRVVYFQNQINKALEYNQLGLDCYKEDGQRKWILHYLTICKAIYLEKLEKIDQALNTLEELWNEKDKIQSLEIVLNMIELRSLILKKTSLYDKAIKYAYEGINLALLNQMDDRAIELYTTLGIIYRHKNEINQAEKCFLSALELEVSKKKEYLLISTYTQLGAVYLDKKNWTLAEKNLLKAISIEADDALRKCHALTFLGDCFFYQKQLDKALTYYNQAYSHANDHDFIQPLYKVTIRLARYWKDIDKSQYYSYLDKMLSIAIELEKDSLKIKHMNNKGEL